MVSEKDKPSTPKEKSIEKATESLLPDIDVQVPMPPVKPAKGDSSERAGGAVSDKNE